MAVLAPQPIEFADTAPVRAEGTAVLDATPAEVWAVLLDYERWPDWFFGLASCAATSDPATGVGSTRQVVLTGGSTFQERFIAWDDERLWAFTATEMKPPGFRSLVERVVIEEVSPGRTRVTYRMAFDLKPALKPLGALLPKVLGRVLTKAMGSLGDQVAQRR